MTSTLSPAPHRPSRTGYARTRTSTTRGARRWVIALLAFAGAVVAGPPAAPVQAAEIITAGYRDVQYGDPAAPGGDDVTADRSQSKLWINDGRWFGILFDPRSTPNAKFRIWRFDMVSQNWVSTGVPVDDRNRSHADVLADGNMLWVASAHRTQGLRIYAFVYNSTTKAYALAAGYPVTLANTTTGTGYASITKDTSGRLWVAFVQGAKVMVASSANGTTWDTPFDVPGKGNDLDPLNSEVATITPLSGSGTSAVGVMWSNQVATDDAFYFAAHVDGDAIGAWQPRETAYHKGTAGTFTYSADNHMSVRTSPTGNVVAAVKTGLNDDPAPNGTDPLVAVLRRTGSPAVAGTWELHQVTDVATSGTRPILVLDTAADEANVFLTHPTLASSGPQAIYRRTASLSTLNFGTSAIGTAVIKSATELAINDATSTKQPTTVSSGILVVATDIPTLRYFHACIGGSCPAAPVANFTADTTSGPAPLSVTFTDTSTNSPTSWSWAFGDGQTSTLQNPTHAYSDPGTYTVSLTATNAAGSDLITKTNYITVAQPPQTAYFPIDPVRLLDTRTGNGLTGTFPANQVRTWTIAGRGGVAADAIAITGNLTVVNQTKAGYISIGPDGNVLGSTSSLNFPVGDIRANGVTLPLDGTGHLSAVYKATAGSTTHLLLDVTGYFRVTTSGGTTYHPTDPTRLLDTRVGNGLSGKFLPGQVREWQIGGRGGVSVNATAVTGNVTVVGQTKAGFVSVGPALTPSPSTSTINFPLGDVRANGVTVKLSAAGKLSAVYAAAAGGSTDLIFDVTGYFTADGTGARFVPVNPARDLDTRVGNGLSGPFATGVPRQWQVGGLAGIDSAATAVVGNVTVVNQTRAGFVSVTPTSQPTPSTSTINFPLGDIRANGMTVKIGAGGKLFAVYKATAGATTHLIYDVFGYYK